MAAGGTDVSASRSSSEAFPQNSAAPTYIIFGDNGGSFGGQDQTATATPTSTAVAATGGSAGASGTGGNGAGGYPNVGSAFSTVQGDGIAGFTWAEIGIGLLLIGAAFYVGKKF